MQTEDQQIADLVERIRSTPAFTDAPARTALFDYLFKRRGAFTSSRLLAKEHFKIAAIDYDAESDRLRERCHKLRLALEQYQDAPGALWRCHLPDAVRGKGYRLVFTPIKREHAATELFWSPHLDSPHQVMVVCNSHLFFYDYEPGMMFRFGDVNAEGEDEEALAALKRQHPDAYKEGLKAHHFYLSAGEVNAFEILQRWFHERTNVLITRHVSRDVLDRQIHNSSPILTGRPGVNRFIRRILESPAAAHLGYRFRKPLGAVHIERPTEEELQVLARFPTSKEGILGPVPDWQVIFGIATRLPNPSGQGFVTIISADYYPRVITQIVATLLDDRRTARAIEQMGWAPDGALPSSFEMLFAVRPSPGNLEGEGHAEFLCGRSYSP